MDYIDNKHSIVSDKFDQMVVKAFAGISTEE